MKTKLIAFVLFLALPSCSKLKGLVNVKVDGEEATTSEDPGSPRAATSAPASSKLVKISNGKAWAKAGGKCKNKRKGQLNPFHNRQTIGSGEILAIADLNRDGTVDVLIRRNGVSTNLVIDGKKYSDVANGNKQLLVAHLNRGRSAAGEIEWEEVIVNRTLNELGQIVNATPGFAAVFDWDGDGDLDIASGSKSTTWDAGLVLYEYVGGKGGARWKEHWVYDEAALSDMLATDLDGDKRADIVFRVPDLPEDASHADQRDHFYWHPAPSAPLSSWDEVREWDEDKKFIAAIETYNSISLMGAWDFDGDGDTDLLYSDGRASAGNHRLQPRDVRKLGWLENRGKGEKWRERIVFVDGGGESMGWGKSYENERSFGVQPLDFDDDGDIDILLAVHNPGRLELLENTGSGDFARSILVDLGGQSRRRVLAADLDGDSAKELVTTSNRGGLQVLDYDEARGKCSRQNSLNGKFESPDSMFLVDVDGDGDLDVVSSGGTYDTVTWVENGAKKRKPATSALPERGPAVARKGGESPRIEAGRPVMCLLDRGSMRYRICGQFQGGACTSWGTGCTPEQRCEWDPGKSKFRKCKGPAHVCAGFTGKCQPSETCIFNPDANRRQPCKKFAAATCTTYADKKCKPSKIALVLP